MLKCRRLLSVTLLLSLVIGLLVTVSPSAAHHTFVVYLTFDDGPIPGNTNRILDILKKYNVKATFFIQGSHIHGNETYLQRELLEGHHIGNHLVSHELNIMAPANPPDSLILSKYTEVDGAIRWGLGDLSAKWD